MPGIAAVVGFIGFFSLMSLILYLTIKHRSKA
jgi:hypothetical protein